MTITDGDLRGIASSVYEAVARPDGFLPVLRRVREAVGGSSAMLFTPLVDPAAGGFGFVDHFDTDLFLRYRAQCWDTDPWAREAERKHAISPSATVTDEDLLPLRDLQRENYYGDLLVPLDVSRLACHIVAGDRDLALPRVYLSIYRGVGARPFSREHARALGVVGPHLLQALRLDRRLRRAEADVESMREAFERVETGLVIVDADKRVLHMNRAAGKICALGLGVSVERRIDGPLGLRAALPDDDTRLQRAVDAALRVDTRRGEPCETSIEPVTIRSPRGSGLLMLTALPLSPALFAGARTSGSRAAIFLESPRDPLPPSHRRLIALFRFTPAECRLAEAIAAGEPVSHMTERLAISENTLRTHLKSIYAKAGVRRISGLAILLSRVVSAGPSEPRDAPGR